MAKERSGFSYRSSDATDGGGTEGALATITEIGFVDEFTYQGRQKDKPQAALRVVYEIDGFKKPWEDHFTCGPSEKYEVVADGDGIRSVGKQAGFNKNSKAHLFFDSLESAAQESGLDIEELTPEIEDEGCCSVRPLEGRRVRLTNRKFTTVGGDEKDAVVVAKFEDDDEKPAKGKSNGKSNGKAAGAKGGAKIEEKTVAAIEALIEEHTSVKKNNLATLVYQENKKDADAKAMMELCFKESFLADEDRPWSYDKKKGVLRAKDDE
jgi:hypothetical protein